MRRGQLSLTSFVIKGEETLRGRRFTDALDIRGSG